MSNIPTFHAESPVSEQSQEDGDSNRPKLFPSQLINEKSGAKIPALDLSTYEKQLSRLLQQHWQESTVLGYPTRALPNKIVILHNHPTFVGPLATLADSELGRNLEDWHRHTFSNTVALSVGNVFGADSLLTLLTNFTRHAGSTPNTDHAQALLQAACIQTLEEFTTPTTYQFRQIGPRHYYGFRLALHYHRNHLAQDARGGSKGRVLGRLSSWFPDENDVTLCIQPLCGDAFVVKLSWQEAFKAITFPPLLEKEVTAYEPPLLSSTATETKMVGGPTAFVRPLI